MKTGNITMESAITYRNFFHALKKCNGSVNYKYSVQEYNANAITYITDTIREIRDGKIPEVKNTKTVLVYERGKSRVITPIDIRDRVTQKVICDQVLVPSIMPHLIYDNGASVKGKGTSFTRRRLNRFLERAKREYGPEQTYALVFDFRKFFDSIPHMLCHETLGKYVVDKRLTDLTMGIIESYKLKDIMMIATRSTRERELQRLKNHGYKGICLGSQISQVMAVTAPDGLDHFIKDKLRMKYYIRHMDDGIILHNSKKELQRVKKEIAAYLESVGLELHAGKSYIAKVTHGFTFLKIKYCFHGDRTVKRLTRSGTVRERRKLNKFQGRIAAGRMCIDDVYNNIQSWNSHATQAKSFRTRKSMFAIYDAKFGGYRITRKYYREHPDAIRKRKVVRL